MNIATNLVWTAFHLLMIKNIDLARRSGIIQQEYVIMGCNALILREIPRFRRNISLPSSGPKIKPSKKAVKVGREVSQVIFDT
jgi:hypothetical protein